MSLLLQACPAWPKLNVLLHDSGYLCCESFTEMFTWAANFTTGACSAQELIEFCSRKNDLFCELSAQPQEDETARMHLSTFQAWNSQTNRVKSKHIAKLLFVLTSPIAASQFVSAIAPPFRIRPLRLTVLHRKFI